MSRRVVYGAGPVRELLARRSRDIAVLYVREARAPRPGDAAVALARDARDRGVAVEPRTRDELDALARDRHHQGVVAVVGAYRYADVDDLLARARGSDRPALLVALDGVQDPHNLGAVVRSAYVLGAHGVIIPADRAAQVTAVVTKASAGATEHLPIAQVTNLVRAIEALKEAGLWTVAVAAGQKARPLCELDATTPLCLVLGAEGAGIRRLVARACDLHAVIPMAAPGVGSLNVSVAAGIALYEVSRQRGGSRGGARRAREG